MGKASRWLKGLLGMKKEKEIPKHTDENDVVKREKRRWSFARPGKDSVPPLGQIPVNIPVSGRDSGNWLGSYLSDSEKEQNKHAIAVAAATAAAADAAVAAAQAAVAVVRLTSHGRGSALFSTGREKSAAVKIQSVFKGFLARKALRALKGLVKLQAHVRGYLVRKQATATLQSMQALVRAQASARAHRARRSIGKDGSVRLPSETRARRSMERFEEPRSEYHSKRLSSSYDPTYDDSPKIVEIDTYNKTKSRSSRRSNYPPSISDYGEDSGFSQYPVSSPLPSPFPVPARLSIPDRHHHHHINNDRYDWGLYEDEDHKCHHRISTSVHSTPRFTNLIRAHGPPTPAKSVCGEGYFRPYYHHHLQHHNSNFNPSYMANTQSFRAKLRSQSAPRQRPEPSPSKKRLSLTEVMASRSSVSGVRMQRPSLDVVQQALFDEIA